MSTDIHKITNYISSTTALNVSRYIEDNFSSLLTDQGFSDFIYSDIPEEIKGDALLATLKTREYFEYNRPHRKERSLDFYSIYSSFAAPEYRLDPDTFYRAFSSFYIMPLSASILSCNTHVIKAIQNLTSIGESSSNIIAFLSEIYADPSSRFVPISDSADELDPDLEFVRKLAYSDTKNLLMPIRDNILDALCFTLTDFSYNDILLENTAVLQLFAATVKNRLSITAPVMIIEPTPFLLKYLRGNNPFRNRVVTFVLQDNTLVSLYTSIFKGTSFQFISFDALQEALYSSENVPTDTLFFASHYMDPETKFDLVNLLVNSTRDIHTLYILDNDFSINSTDSLLKSTLSKMVIQKAWLFPAGIQDSTCPARKTLLQCTYGYCEHSDDISIIRYSLASSKKNQCLVPYAFQAHTTQSILQSTSVSIRSIFQNQYVMAISKTDRGRNRAHGYHYSPEITVFYTVSGGDTTDKPYRIRAYTRTPADRSLDSSIIVGSERSTKKIHPDNIEQWIENDYMDDPKGKKSIASVYQEYYHNKPVTLRTFVLMNYQWAAELPDKLQAFLNNVSHSSLGEIFLDRLSPAMIESTEEGFSLTSKSHMALLAELYDLAIQQGHCTTNPAREYIQANRIDHNALYQVNSNLKRKHFPIGLFQKIYKSVLRGYRKGNLIQFAALICLLLGLDANIVDAFRWSDFVPVHIGSDPVISFYQFCVQRQLCNDGSEIRFFHRPEQYRSIPCPSILSELLIKEYKTVLLNNLGMPDEYIKKQYIFADPNCASEEPSLLFTPKQLRQEIRKMIKKLDLPPELIPIPDERKGTIETNLAYYRGDLFRSNFDYYARHVGIFESGELEYLLGVQASTTFSRHYCDYSNKYAQYILFIKMERICHKLISHNDLGSGQIQNEKIDGSFTLRSKPDTNSCTRITILLNIQPHCGAEIVIDADHGTDVEIHSIKGNKS